MTHFTTNGPSLLPDFNEDGQFEVIQRDNGLLTGRSWITIVSDEGDDIYTQQISPADPGQDTYVPSLIYASNASFLGYGEIKDINSYTDVFITNASLAVNRDLLGGVSQDSDGYPFNDPGTPEELYADRSFETTFVLPTTNADAFELITGRVANGVGGVWTFTNTPGVFGHRFTASVFTPVGVPTGPNPRSARIEVKNGTTDSDETDALFIVTWDSNSLAPGGMSTVTPPLLEQISYDWNTPVSGDAFGVITLPEPIEASSPAEPSYRLPMPANVPVLLDSYEIAHGSLRGFIDIEQHDVRYEFTTLTQFPVDDPLNFNGDDGNVVRDANGAPVLNAAGQPLRSSTLVFRRVVEPATVLPWRLAGLFNVFGPDEGDFDRFDSRLMTGVLTYIEDVNGSGEIFYRPAVELTFQAVEDNNEDTDPDVEPIDATEGDIIGLQEVGRVTVDAEYAVFNQPEQFVGGNFTFYDGHDFSRNLTVDLLAPGATISIETPILYNPPGGLDEDGLEIDSEPVDSPNGHFIDLRASNTILQAQMWSGTSFNLRDSLAGQAKAEQLFVNAANAAKTYDIRVKDDPLTDSVRRSKVFISTTGSLAGLLPSAPGLLPENAESVYVLSNTGDVFIEGTVAGDYQSYIMQSPIEKADDSDLYGTANRAPYYLTTQSMISGAITGRIRGISLAVTLGNDTPTVYDDTRNGGSSAYNVVTLQTEVDSIRIQASDRARNPIQTPFPYDLWISEQDKLRVDAVAASSLPIAIYSGDDLTWNATLLSASDVAAEALEGDLDLNAPLHTTFGSISLAASRLSVRNSVRVLDTFNDESSLYVNDITLTARDGDLLLTGPISGVNTVELIQSGDGGISGDSRVVAERVLVRADGDVTIKTETAELAGSAESISVDETDDIFVNEFSVTGGYISLVANGYDPLALEVDEFGLPTVDDEGNPTGNRVSVPALRASLPDARVLVASAPRGSIDVRLSNAESLTIGDAAKIASRTAVSMVAAGDVYIESLGGNIDVLDAPYAASSAFRVRAASTEDLDGTYANRTPGTFPDTLTANNPGVLRIDGLQMRVREFVLLKDQGNGRENGVYQVVSPGTATTRWVLRRVATLDQTFEIPEFLRVSVNEGTQAGRVYVVKDYLNELGTTPRAVTTVLNNYDAIEVRAVSTAELQAEYSNDPISGSWTLSSSSDSEIPLFDGVRLELGDLVLVRMGSRNLAGEATRASNGLYTVSNVGSDLSPWVLTEVQDVFGDPITEGLFKASEGTYSAKKTGVAFKVYFDSLGWADMDIEEDIVFTQIGSRDVNDAVRFITSTNLGTNVATGSLGKMISLYNQNSYVNQPDLEIDPEGEPIPQSQSFAFSATLGGAIVLTQELPRITRQISIDASQFVTASPVPVIVDGSRIRTNRDWSVVEGAESVSGFEFITSTVPEVVFAEVADARVISETEFAVEVTPGDPQYQQILEAFVVGRSLDSESIDVDDGLIASRIRKITRSEDGTGAVTLTVEVTGGSLPGAVDDVIAVSVARFSDASGSSLAGMYVGGFGRGAAVKLTNADDVLIKDMRLGTILASQRNSATLLPQRLSNKVGIELEGNAAGFNTVATSTIYASTQAGVRLGDDAQLRVVGTQIGASGFENAIGVDVVDGTLLFGLMPANVSFRRISTRVESPTTFSVPGSIQALASLYEGLGVSSPGIAPDDGAIAASIASISEPNSLGRVTITIVGGTVRQGTGESMSVAFGSFTRLQAGSNEVPMPIGIRPEDIFLGQTISGTGIPGGATIVKANATTLFLSTPATQSSEPGQSVAVVIGTPARNTVSQNSRGVVIRGGSSSFIGTDISNSVFDGILITPTTASRGTTAVTIGGSAGRVGLGGRATDKDLAFAGNAIFGNGSAGIRVAANALESDVVIRGNRLGVTRDGALNLNKGGNIVAPAAFYGPVEGTFVENNQQLTFEKFNDSTHTLLVTSAEAHGLRDNDPVRLRIQTSTGAIYDAVLAVRSVDSPRQFTVVVPVTQLTARNVPSSSTAFTVTGSPQDISGLYVGMGVSSPNITPIDRNLPVSVASISAPDPVTGRVTIGLTNGTVRPGSSWQVGFTTYTVLGATGTLDRVRFEVTLAEDHLLKTGHLLWLEFLARNGQPGSVQDARKIMRIPGVPNRFLVDGVAGMTAGAGGPVYINRYGRQTGGAPVQYAFQLRRTDQVDYEGNVHGLASTVVAAPSGGVVSRPNPVVGQGPVVRPPVRR